MEWIKIQNRIMYPILYGIDKKNKIKEWRIEVFDKGTYSIVEWKYGYTDSKKIEYQLRVDMGKNIGKSNETTHYQQALLEARSKWNKKKDIEGYKEDIDEVKKIMSSSNTNNETCKEQISMSTSISEQVFPMLAQEYKKHIKKVVYGCYIQPKLDGYRMVYNNKTKKVTTRTAKDYKILYNTELYKELSGINYVLDGELYVHDTNFNFEIYGVLRKQKGLTEGDKRNLEKIEYHVYDIIDVEKTYEERMNILKDLFKDNQFKKLKNVRTERCETKEDVESWHKKFIEDNYEGSMIRNAKGFYKCKFRSYDLLKKKDFDDAEYEIVDIASESDSKTMDKLVVWVCKTENGQLFNVRPKGTESERKMLYKESKKYIGSKLWVKYFGLTENGIPRFPSTKTESYMSYIRNVVE
jgi:ATP-dependent DNA ligase